MRTRDFMRRKKERRKELKDTRAMDFCRVRRRRFFFIKHFYWCIYDIFTQFISDWRERSTERTRNPSRKRDGVSQGRNPKEGKKGKRIPSCLACNNFFDDGIKWRNATSKRSIDFSEDDGKENESKVGPDPGRLSPTPHTTNRDGSETTNRRKTRGKGTWDTIRPDEKEEKKEKKEASSCGCNERFIFRDMFYVNIALFYTNRKKPTTREREPAKKRTFPKLRERKGKSRDLEISDVGIPLRTRAENNTNKWIQLSIMLLAANTHTHDTTDRPAFEDKN